MCITPSECRAMETIFVVSGPNETTRVHCRTLCVCLTRRVTWRFLIKVNSVSVEFLLRFFPRGTFFNSDSKNIFLNQTIIISPVCRQILFCSFFSAKNFLRLVLISVDVLLCLLLPKHNLAFCFFSITAINALHSDEFARSSEGYFAITRAQTYIAHFRHCYRRDEPNESEKRLDSTSIIGARQSSESPVLSFQSVGRRTRTGYCRRMEKVVDKQQASATYGERESTGRRLRSESRSEIVLAIRESNTTSR